MGSIHTPVFLRHKPLFGLDIGHDSLKVMQLQAGRSQNANRSYELLGYGTTTFDPSAIDNGVIVKHEVIAKATLELFQHHLIGSINTRRVALTIPSYRSYTRSLQLPKLSRKEMVEAVHMEAEQYIPVPLEELYIDYTIVQQAAETCDALVVAVPKKIVDSYVTLSQLLGLDAMAIETTMAAAARLFVSSPTDNTVSVLIDFGSLTADLSILQHTTLVTGTVPAGGLVFTDAIREKLHISQAEAGIIKTKYGLGVSKKQAEITNALTPTLEKLLKEIRRMIRYYEQHYGAEQSVGQVIMLGGGANMPGLSEYLTNALRLPVRSYDPWQHFDHRHLQAPINPDKPMFATVAGLSLMTPGEVFAG